MLILVLALFFAMSGIGAASAAPATPSKGSEIDVSDCAWPIHTDGRHSGFGFNDRFGAYSGVMMFTDLPGGHWRFKGEYPKARWMSYESYDRLVGSQDAISGQTIDADAGSSNPFAPGAAPYKPGNHYEVDLVNAPPEQRDANAHNLFYGAWKNDPAYGKFLHSGIQSVLYRVYAAPGDVDSLGGVGRPHMSWVVDDPKTSPFADSGQACASLEEAHRAYAPWPQIVSGLESINDTVIAPQIVPFAQRNLQGIGPDYTSPPAVNVLRPSPNGYGAPEGLWFNSRTPYIGTTPNKAVGPLLVIRFKTPTFPRIDEGKPAVGNEQTQYWDWCSTQFLTPLNYTIACHHDSQFTVDKDGWATLVVSTDDERPVIDGKPYEDWLPMAGNVGITVMRQLDPNEKTFPQSPYFMPPTKVGDTNLPIDIIPGITQQRDIKNHMGEYFPIEKYCTRAEFEKDRCATAAPRISDGVTQLLPQSR